MTVSVLWFFPLLIGQRLTEVLISRRNMRILEMVGGKEYYPHTFLAIAMLHVMFTVSLLVESAPWRVPADVVTWVGIALFLLLQWIRYWCISSLGTWWNARIVLVPGGHVKRCGPYRFLKHPNYLVVVLEFILLPVVLRAPVTFAAYFPAVVLLLRHRIVLEEKALREMTDYDVRFPAG